MNRSDKYFPLIMLILIFLIAGMIIQWNQPRRSHRVYKIIVPTPVQYETDGECVDYGRINAGKAGAAIAVYQEFQRADRRLNAIYRRIRRDNQRNRSFLIKLRDAERAWLKYRDAQLDAFYPQYREADRCNSDYAIAYYLEKAHLTWERVKQLKEWIRNYREDLVGMGSRGQAGGAWGT